MPPAGTVYIVDDDQEVCASIRRLMTEVDLPVEAFYRASDFLQNHDPHKPGCLILDVRMPDMGGLDLQKRLIELGSPLPLIMVSAHGDIPMVAEAMRRGALDFFEKPFRAQQLLDRVLEALALSAQRLRQQAEVAELRERFAALTEREREVVERACNGQTNKQIAQQLGVSPQAIDAARAKAMAKVRVGSLPELARLWQCLQCKHMNQHPVGMV